MNITYRHKEYRHLNDFNRYGVTETRWEKNVPELMDKEYKKIMQQRRSCFSNKNWKPFPVRSYAFSRTFVKNLYMSYH